MNILAVGAHYDDVELGCSGTLMKHIDQGDEVTIVVVTDSSYKNPKGVTIRSGEKAFQEGLKAAAIIGAELFCLNFKTFLVSFAEELTKKLNLIIDEAEIDTVYSHWVHDLHRDHQYTARNALMAARHVPRFLMYRSNYYDTEVQFRGNFYSDISPYFDRKLKAIKAHQSELKRVRYGWIPFFTNQHANDGQKIGVNYAESFEVVRYLI